MVSQAIRIKSRVTGAAGAPSSLKTGELALNHIDKLLYAGFGNDGEGYATSIEVIGGAEVLGDPASDIEEIVLKDDADNCTNSRGILCDVAGDAKVTTRDGTTLTIPLQKGYNPLRLSRVWSTGTTATGIFALY